MVDFVSQEYQRYEVGCNDKFEQCKKIYDHWTGKPPMKTEDWHNAVHVPMTLEAEQTITPRLFSALFPSEDPVECRVYDPATEEQGIIIKSMIKKQFMLSNVQGEALSALTQCTLYGTGYVEAGWLVERSWQVAPQSGERYYAIVANRNDCKWVNFFEMYPHPAKLRMADGLPIIRRRFCDAEYLKRLAENPYLQFKDIDKALNSTPVEGIPSHILGPDGKQLELKNREKYEILEYWGPWDMSYMADKEKVVTKKGVPHCIMVVNRDVLIRGIPNPYNHQKPPFCKLTLFTDAIPNWFGVGTGTIGKPTQERINKMVNQRLDNVDLVLNKQGFYNGNDVLINTKKLQISQPGLWHKCSDTVTSIRWMDTPDVTSSSYKEEEIAKADFRESTGATVPLMPTDEGQHRTAQGINLLQGAAGARFKPVLRKLETDFIQELATMYLSNLQQFMAVPEWIDITSANGAQQPVQVSPEAIQARVQFIPTGISEALNKEVQIGQLLRFKELTIQDPTINRAEINKRIGELMGFKDLHKLVIAQQPMVQQPGGLNPQDQELIQQRLAEGADPQAIKMELLGNAPGQPPMSNQSNQGGAPNAGPG